MCYQILRRVALGALACSSLVSLQASADVAASTTPDQLFGHSAKVTLSKKSGAPPSRTERDASLLGFVLSWNSVAIDASGLDHTPVSSEEKRAFGEALGPGRASRAMAIVHIAMFDALVAIKGDYQPYTQLPRVEYPESVSARAAVAQAAHDSLVAMYPSQKEIFARKLQESLSAVPTRHARVAGRKVGAGAARRILQARAHDGADYLEPTMGKDFMPSDQPGGWRADPISLGTVALGAKWGHVAPFVLAASDQFRVPQPPALTSKEYAAAYDEVRRLGGDGVVTPTERTEEQAFIGIYWAYDGTPSLCAPPRMYNQIAKTIAKQMGSDAMQTARLLALVNISLADSGIAIWESKFHYQVWRPVTAIREADAGTGPTGAGDGNPATIGDPNFVPLGAPASNLTAPNFTPPFPSYPSGHAGFGGALFQILRRFYGTDEIAFTFVSDEYNGITLDNQGAVRQLHPRSFKNLSQAEEENGRSRIYLGIHWAFDVTEGLTQGEQVADYVFDRIYLPLQPAK